LTVIEEMHQAHVARRVRLQFVPSIGKVTPLFVSMPDLRISGTGMATVGFPIEDADEPRPPAEPVNNDDDVIVQPPPIYQPSWKRIAREVCFKHGITLMELLSRRKPKPIVAARHEFFYRCRKETSMSLPQIGRRAGRDHSTVIHGIKQHERKMEEANA
jgi:hypothetical protein